MRHFGVFLLLLGISIGLFLYWPTTITRSEHAGIAKRQQILPNASNLSGAPSTNFPRYSPDVALNWPVSAERGHASPPTLVNRRETESIASTPVDVAAAPDWQSSTTYVAGSNSPPSRATQPKAKDPASRYELVSEIQRYLKLRGCYWGRIDGAWGAGSRSAMQTYLDRINAELPLNEPDHVLLALLQASDSQRCAACPAGQASTIGGRCSPEAMYASEQRRSVGRELGAAAFQERMAIGGPTGVSPPSVEEDAWSSDGSDISDYAFDDGDRPEPALESHDPQTSAGSKRRRSRSVQAARERNLMLSLGGGF